MGTTEEPRRHWLEPPEWWKKAKPLRWLAIGTIVAAVGSVFWTAKTIMTPSTHPEKEKYMEVASDPARLNAGKTEFTVTSVHPKPSAKYPPRDRDTLQSKTFKHLGVEGALTLEFFNDRLYEATFVPDTLDDYVEALHKADPRLKRDRNGHAEQRMGNLRIASNVDFALTDVGKDLHSKPYVIWQDLRLTQQLDEWDKNFIALPR
jgi:hypothetical protein